MTRFTLTHEINCNEEKFWEVFFDKEFNEKLYLGQLGFSKYLITESRETDTQTHRKVEAVPKIDLPGPVAKLLGPGFSYREEGVFEKGTKRWSWKIIPSQMADKLVNTGNVRVEKVGDSKVRRVAELTIEAKVFGLGGLIESSTEKQFRDGWDKSAVFMNKWLAK
jgi:hypothetical protein